MRVCCKLETTKCLGDRFTYGFLTNQLLLHDKLVPHIFCHSHFAILAPGSSKTSDQNDKHYNTCNFFFLTE